MTLERLAYASPWRCIAPSAKALFCACAMTAAWLTASPRAAGSLALVMGVITVAAARTPWRHYLRVLRAPLGFLALSCLTMLVTVTPDDHGLAGWRLAPELVPQVMMTVARAAALCTALLLLVLTTPLGDLLGLMRRLRVPTLLLDLMALAYRMQTVLGEVWSDSITAQRARLGYDGRRQAFRSLAALISNMALQVWARASALQAAADARNDTGELRFLTPQFEKSSRHHLVAMLAGLGLVAAVLSGVAG